MTEDKQYDDDASIEPPEDPVLLPTESGRDRGILSTADREFLRGNKSYEHRQAIANRRQDIRERVRNSIADFADLCAYWTDEERDKSFSELPEEALRYHFEMMVGFLYRSLDMDREQLENVVAGGIYKADALHRGERWKGEVADVDVDIDIDYELDADAIYERFAQEGDAVLTPEEIGVLVLAGKLDRDDVEALRQPRTEREVANAIADSIEEEDDDE